MFSSEGGKKHILFTNHSHKPLWQQWLLRIISSCQVPFSSERTDLSWGVAPEPKRQQESLVENNIMKKWSKIQQFLQLQ